MQAKCYGVDWRREVAPTGHFHQGFHSVCAGEHPALGRVLAGGTLRDEGLWRGGCPTLDLLLIVRRQAVGVVEQGGRRVDKDDVLVQGAGHVGQRGDIGLRNSEQAVPQFPSEALNLRVGENHEDGHHKSSRQLNKADQVCLGTNTSNAKCVGRSGVSAPLARRNGAAEEEVETLRGVMTLAALAT